MTTEYTNKEYWDKYWEKRTGAIEIKRNPKKYSTNALLDIFEKYLEINSGLTILEIGGAPGQYLMYMNKQFGYQANALDYSSVGNQKTLKNFQSENLKVNVYERNLFSDNFSDNIPIFDIVYSLGFAEHFENLNDVIGRHLKLLKPGGKLIIGVPNLGGIYQWFLKQLAPNHLAIHNLKSMDLRNWKLFEKDFELDVIFRDYIGGFEPLVMKKIEKRTVKNVVLYLFVTCLMMIFSFHLKFLRKYNSSKLSSYLIGIYTKSLK